MKNQMNYQENGKMILNYNGVEITLSQAPSAENYQERVCYDTTGRDAAGNEYYLRWDTTDRWDAANEAGIDENGAPCDAFFEDEFNACDWDNPAEVRVTLHAEEAEEAEEALMHRYCDGDAETITVSEDGQTGLQTANGVLCCFNPANSHYYVDSPENRAMLLEGLKQSEDCKAEWAEEEYAHRNYAVNTDAE